MSVCEDRANEIINKLKAVKMGKDKWPDGGPKAWLKAKLESWSLTDMNELIRRP